MGGAAYNISFKPQTLPDLFRNASLKYVAGREESSTGNVGVDMASAPDGIYYAYVGYWVYSSWWKVVKTGTTLTKSLLACVNQNYGNVFIRNTVVYLGGDRQGSPISVYGGIVAIFQFNGYSSSQADALLSGRTMAGIKGSNGSSVGMIWASTSDLANKTIIMAHNYYIAIDIMNASSQVGEVLFSNCEANPSLMWYTSNRQYLSISGSNYTPARGIGFFSIA